MTQRKIRWGGLEVDVLEYHLRRSQEATFVQGLSEAQKYLGEEKRRGKDSLVTFCSRRSEQKDRLLLAWEARTPAPVKGALIPEGGEKAIVPSAPASAGFDVAPIVELLVEEIRGRIAPLVEGMVDALIASGKERLSRELGEFQAKLMTETSGSTAVPRKPRVILIGGWPKLVQAVQEKAKQVAISGMEKVTSVASLKGSTAFHIVVMRKVGHQVELSLKSQGTKYTVAVGAVDAILHIINEKFPVQPEIFQ